jgi:hypothetical protein
LRVRGLGIAAATRRPRQSQQLPVLGTPPLSSHASLDERVAQRVTAQSALVSHAIAASSSHVPPAFPSPGVASPMQASWMRQATKPGLPQVERAPQRTDVRRQRRESAPPDVRTCWLVSCEMQRTYWPWFFHGTTEPSGALFPSQGHAAAIAASAAATAAASQVFGAASAGDERSAAMASVAVNAMVSRTSDFMVPLRSPSSWNVEAESGRHRFEVPGLRGALARSVATAESGEPGKPLSRRL